LPTGDGTQVVYTEDMNLFIMGLKEECNNGAEALLTLIARLNRAWNVYDCSDVVLYWDEGEHVTLAKSYIQECRLEKTEEEFDTHQKLALSELEENPDWEPITYGELYTDYKLMMSHLPQRRRVLKWVADMLIKHVHVPPGKSLWLDRPPYYPTSLIIRWDSTAKEHVHIPWTKNATVQIGESDFKPFYYMRHVFPDASFIISSKDGDTFMIALMFLGYCIDKKNEMINRNLWIKTTDVNEVINIEDEEQLKELLTVPALSKCIVLEAFKNSWRNRANAERQKAEGINVDPFAPQNAHLDKCLAFRREDFIDAKELWRSRLEYHAQAISLRANPMRPTLAIDLLFSEMMVALLCGNDMCPDGFPGIGEKWLYELWLRHAVELGPLVRVERDSYARTSVRLALATDEPECGASGLWRLVRLAYQQKIFSKLDPTNKKRVEVFHELLTLKEMNEKWPEFKIGAKTYKVPTACEAGLVLSKCLYALFYYANGWRGKFGLPDELSCDSMGRTQTGWILDDPKGPRERSNVRLALPSEVSPDVIDYYSDANLNDKFEYTKSTRPPAHDECNAFSTMNKRKPVAAGTGAKRQKNK